MPALGGVRTACNKAPWYDILIARVSVATTRDKSMHDRRRRIRDIVTSAFQVRFSSDTVKPILTLFQRRYNCQVSRSIIMLGSHEYSSPFPTVVDSPDLSAFTWLCPLYVDDSFEAS